jgi:hypothetical protein
MMKVHQVIDWLMVAGLAVAGASAITYGIMTDYQVALVLGCASSITGFLLCRLLRKTHKEENENIFH